MTNQEAYEKVTARIVDALEQGTVPWRKCWQTSGAQRGVAGHVYRGANAVITSVVAYLDGYSDPRWITYRQAKKRGGHVRKGEKGTPIILWKWVSKESDESRKDDESKKRGFCFARVYTVFNVEQCEGLELDPIVDERPNDPDAEAERIVAGYLEHGPSFVQGGDVACYSPTKDEVRVPKLDRFDSTAAYYSVLFHELTHSTGHEARLARPGVTDKTMFGDHAYSKEELVAEIGAAMLYSVAGVECPEVEDNQAAYVAGWLDKIKGDASLVVYAAQQAQKAVDRIVGEQSREDEQEAA